MKLQEELKAIRDNDSRISISRNNGFTLWSNMDGHENWNFYRASKISNWIANEMIAKTPTNFGGYPDGIISKLFKVCFGNLKGHSIKLKNNSI